MADYQKFGGFKGNRDGGRDRGNFRGGFEKGGFKNRSDKPMQMFSATCAECGNTCEVPFRPVAGRPVFCKNCFSGKREGGERPFTPERSFAPKQNFAPKAEFTAAPKPTSDDKQIAELKRALDAVNSKLDRIITQLMPKGAAQSPMNIKEEKSEEKKTVEAHKKAVVEVKKMEMKAPATEKKAAETPKKAAAKSAVKAKTVEKKKKK